MSEWPAKPPRDERGRLLPGATLNPGGQIKSAEQRAALEAIRHAFNPRIVDMIIEVWQEGNAKVKAQVLATLLPYLFGRPATEHHRTITKFEDLLKALGSNEKIVDVVADGETQKDLD